MNSYTETGKIAQLKRLVNTLHYMIKRTVPNDHLEHLVLLRKANGCEMGEQYHTLYGFGEVLECLDKVVIQDITQKVSQKRFVGGKQDEATDKRLLSQEAVELSIVKQISLGKFSWESRGWRRKMQKQYFAYYVSFSVSYCNWN